MCLTKGGKNGGKTWGGKIPGWKKIRLKVNLALDHELNTQYEQQGYQGYQGCQGCQGYQGYQGS